MQNSIEVTNLKKYYGDIKAVDDISFSVKSGSLFAFLGLNGAGKSTTINVLCSIIKKNAGQILIDGLDLDRHAAEIKKKIGIVFQGSVLDAQLNVLQNLRSRASLYALGRKETLSRIEHLSGVFDLYAILKRNYSTLSGGQRRRVDIARALLNEPKILVLDEPTTGLDPTTRAVVWRVLEGLVKDKGLTVFLTTHYMEEVTRADQVVILDAGRIVADGSPDELKNRYTSDFVRVINKRTEENDAMLRENGYGFEYKNNAYFVKVEDAAAALGFLNKHNQFAADFEVLKGDMDDVFLNVTGKKLEA